MDRDFRDAIGGKQGVRLIAGHRRGPFPRRLPIETILICRSKCEMFIYEARDWGNCGDGSPVRRSVELVVGLTLPVHCHCSPVVVTLPLTLRGRLVDSFRVSSSWQEVTKLAIEGLVPHRRLRDPGPPPSQSHSHLGWLR